MAAVLACGPDAVLSHRSAAALWSLRPSAPSQTDVTVPGRTRAGQDGIAVHNVRALHPRDRNTVDGIPVTSVHRTLLDYAELAAPNQLGWAFEAADRIDLLDLRAIDELCARSPGRHGLRALQALATEHRGPAPETRSELERRFLALIREAGLPEPSVNVLVAGFMVDFYWPSSCLVVELDGYAFHRTRRSFEDDRAKDVQLQLAGCRVLRLTDRGLTERPGAVRDDVARALNPDGAAASDR
jgi:very-short-patch-repair endonuclease